MPEVDVEILHETQSLCPVCLRRLDARYVRQGQSILLERTCPEHGTFAVDIWHERTEGDVTPPRFDGWSRPKTPSYPREPRTAVRYGCPYDCGLCPAHAQHTCTGLVEVTLRCNMACPICYAAAGGAVPDDPSLETVAFQLDSLRRASPGCNVQLSGGEPTVRDDLPAIIRMAREIGTYETSILPYEDCCTVFTPRHPATRPVLEDVVQAESILDIDGLVAKALEGETWVRVKP